MQGLLEGKVAVITGAGSGVGRAAVKLWTEHGAKVIAADIDLPTAEESVKLAGAQQGKARAIACNVADPSQVEAAVQAAVETFGRLDVIYNNAGITINPLPGQGLKKFVDATLINREEAA
jgi:NAD(P)-dependent dehydrogenase (short-subunit alcohol dehydrogenase family)